jgi:hypothetical protein
MAPDIEVSGSSQTLITLTFLTPRAKAWAAERVESEGWQWLGPSLVVEPQMGYELAVGAVEDGLTLGDG